MPTISSSTRLSLLSPLLLLVLLTITTTTAFRFSSPSSTLSTTTHPPTRRYYAAAPTTTTANTPTTTSFLPHATTDNNNNDSDDSDSLTDTPPPPPRVRPPPTPIQYNSPLFSPKLIDSLWNEQRRPLLRLGTKGVQPSHLNSLRELLDAHNVVRIKVNTLSHQQTNIQTLAEKLMASPLSNEGKDKEKALGMVLRVKGKEFLVGRTDKMEALKKKVEQEK